IGLLLVVAFEAHAIAGLDHFLQQRDDRRGVDELAVALRPEARRRALLPPHAALRAPVPDPRRAGARVHDVGAPITQFGKPVAMAGKKQIRNTATNISPTNGITPQTTSRSGMS